MSDNGYEQHKGRYDADKNPKDLAKIIHLINGQTQRYMAGGTYSWIIGYLNLSPIHFYVSF